VEVLEWLRRQSLCRETALQRNPMAVGGTPVWLDVVERENGQSRKLMNTCRVFPALLFPSLRVRGFRSSLGVAKDDSG